MPLTVKVDNPNLPDGAEIGIDGLGIAINGEHTEFSDEEVQNFKQKNTVFTHVSGPTGVVTETKIPHIDHLIGRAPFVTIVKNTFSNPEPVHDPGPTVFDLEEKEEDNA